MSKKTNAEKQKRRTRPAHKRKNRAKRPNPFVLPKGVKMGDGPIELPALSGLPSFLINSSLDLVIAQLSSEIGRPTVIALLLALRSFLKAGGSIEAAAASFRSPDNPEAQPEEGAQGQDREP